MEINLTLRTTKPDEVAKLIKLLSDLNGTSVEVSGPSGPVIKMETVKTDAVSTQVETKEQAQGQVQLDMDLLRLKTQTAMSANVDNKAKIKAKLTELGAPSLPPLKKEQWAVYNEFLDQLIGGK